jgi:outer membrane cobalamin receptor
VTSTLKHAEPISAAAAAISVVTGDDIRRAGITTLPEALRLVTGVQVARFDGRTWAITARGFNISTANSAFADRDAEMRARNAGFQRFVSKPYDFLELVLAVADVSRIGNP